MNEENTTLSVAAEESADENTGGTAGASEPFGDETVAPAVPEQTPAAAQTADDGDATDSDEVARQLHARLANDFCALAKELPEMKAFSDLPSAVVEMAVSENISLFDAYLRHSFFENRRIGAAKSAAESAAKSAVGSLADEPIYQNPEVDAFVHALRQSLR